ncbi:glycine-rich domain-containing protein [Flavobacterium sp. N1994]|uniref:glycine-rich domain-containing protein n=1 Tax=Flavobacterium sp. N1994 TaxID=2986827 RepID=UPI0022218F13|nr:T9SS type A sorting domain-containing protein [Flavobacterium sp. N1994]
MKRIYLSLSLLISMIFSVSAQQLNVDVLVVSGGGSGGAGFGGGGGGGAVKYFTNQSISGAIATTVGAGGAAVSTANGIVVGNPGASSRFGSLIATSSSSANGPNADGGGGGGAGSGGGAGGNTTTSLLSGGTAVSGMGNNGGGSQGNNKNFSNICGGGGGGAGAVGGLGGTSNGVKGGNGGVGVSNSITGVAVFYGGGGGGGVTFNGSAAGVGGNGGGGAGSKGDVTATSGTANTGGGGGGFGSTNGGVSNNLSGAGGSGIVIVRYLGSVIRATGGTVTQVGNYTIHTFTSSGTFTVGPTITTSSTATAVCKSTSAQNSSLAYSATTLAPTTYRISWSGTPANSFAAVTDATLTLGQISIAVPANTTEGTYTGTITVKNAAGDVSIGTNFTITVNALPTITAGNVSGCTGTAIALVGSPAGGTFSVANPYTGPSTTYTYSYTDVNGCSATSASATITPNPLPIVTAGNVSGCAGTAITLVGSPAGGTFSVANPYTGPSTTYTYSYTDGNGCSATSASATITTNSLPTVTAGNVSGCGGTAIALVGSPAGGTFSVANPYTGPSTTYTYSYTNGNGCTATSASATITTNPLPIVTSGNVSGCAGTAIALVGSPAGGTFSIANPYTGPSTTYTYSYTDGNGCAATSASATITTNPLPATPTISAGGATSFCAGGSVVLTATAGSSYSWSNGATSQSITVTTTGNYTVQVTNSFGCVSASSLPTTVTVTAQPLWYLDADGDHYYTGVAIPSCTSPGAGYTTSGLLGGGDCADDNSAINPGATEICYNNIDDNCNGIKSEGCAPVVVNMTPSYNNTTLVSLATAIPAVSYTYPGTSNIKYRFSITNVTTNVTSADIIQTSRYVTIPSALHVYGATYTIKVSAVINDEVVPFYGNTITVTGPTVQLITLSSASCGASLATLASTISANGGLNATGYTFRIRLTTDNGPTPNYGFSSSATRFVGANSFAGFPLQYNTSYQVAVKYSYIDPLTSLPVESAYGAECSVSTPSIPLIGLAAPTCGSQVATMNAGITASPAAYATGYRFRIRLTSDNGPTPTYYYTLPNASRFSSLVAFQGVTFAYNTQYSIAVEYSILSNSVTQWSGFGSECIVKTPFFPVTSLVPSQCGLSTATSLTQQLNITPYPGFPNYKVKLDEISGESITNSQEIVITYSNFRLNQFSIAQLGKNYNVSVAIKLNGVFGDYSTACDLFTAAPTRTVKLPFKASAYPNPFANNFMLAVTTSSKSVVGIKVYDMVGRLIEQRQVNTSDIENTTIGDSYPSGIYNVVVSQEDSIETVRVIKR